MVLGLSRQGVIAFAALALTFPAVAYAAPETFTVPLTGTQQVPPVKTNGSGTADLTYDPGTRDVTWTIHDKDLSSPVTMAHFHDAAEGKNGPVKVWLSKKGAASVPNPITGHATLTEAEAKSMMAGDYYVNVHTKDHPSGEIRGQVMPPKS